LDALTATAEPAALGARPEPHPSRRIADIEMLRGIAVLFVIFHHAHSDLVTWPSSSFDLLYSYANFWPGVDLFFAISGFVIARSLLPALEAAGDGATRFRTVIAFWIRRAWRLLPAAWLWLGITLLATLVFNRSGVFGTVHANVGATIAGMLDVANFRFAASFMQSEYGASFHYWSLSLEEQFYVLLPLAAVTFGRRLPAMLAILALIQFLTLRNTPLLMDVRTDAILFGVLIAIWSRHPSYRLVEPTGLAASRLGRLLTLGVLFGGIVTFAADQLQIVSIRVGLIALLSSALVLIASFDRDYLWPDGLAKRVLIWVGSRSYGIYLIHLSAFYTTRELLFRLHPAGWVPGKADFLPLVLIAAALILVASELSYRLVEVPLRDRGARIARRFAARTA